MNNQRFLNGNSDDRREMDEALARIRSNTGERPETALAPPAPEIFNLKCFCAVVDQPYILRFVRQSGGLFRLAERIKIEPNQRTGSTGSSIRNIQTTIDLRLFERNYGPCPWCGCNSGFTKCSCGIVCDGRQTGDLFRCRKSCGREFVGIPLKEVSGTQPVREQRASSEPEQSAKQVPEPTRAPSFDKMLPSSTAIVPTRRY
jgi:hypothetical protein